MALHLFTSLSGAPGVSTLALAAALARPGAALADLDRDLDCLLSTGWWAGHDCRGRGAGTLVRRLRAGETPSAAEACLPMPEGVGLFLPGFDGASAVVQADPWWAELARTVRGWSDDVVVDGGRAQAMGPPAGLLAAADTWSIVTRSALSQLAAIRLHAGRVRAAAERAGLEPRLVVVGPGQPYASAEIAAELGFSVVAEVPHDPRAAMMLASGASMQRLRRRPLVRAAGRLLDVLADRPAQDVAS